MVREDRRRLDVVIIAGGDGTLHAALPALRGTGAPLGALPRGAASDFARTLGLPPAVESAARSILAIRVRWTDVGRVDGRPFLNVARIGLEARARDAVAGSRKRRWGIGSYPDVPWKPVFEKGQE